MSDRRRLGASDGPPYLAAAPEELDDIGVDVPALAPGESVVVVVKLPRRRSGRAVAWVTLAGWEVSLTDRGSPALQLSTSGP